MQDYSAGPVVEFCVSILKRNIHGFTSQSAETARRAGPRESLQSKISWGSEERRRDEESLGQ